MPRKHHASPQKALSREGRRALKLVAEAQRQYERYQELRDVSAILELQEPSDPSVPDWHTPLKLVFRGSHRSPGDHGQTDFPAPGARQIGNPEMGDTCFLSPVRGAERRLHCSETRVPH